MYGVSAKYQTTGSHRIPQKKPKIKPEQKGLQELALAKRNQNVFLNDKVLQQNIAYKRQNQEHPAEINFYKLNENSNSSKSNNSKGTPEKKQRPQSTTNWNSKTLLNKQSDTRISKHRSLSKKMSQIRASSASMRQKSPPSQKEVFFTSKFNQNFNKERYLTKLDSLALKSDGIEEITTLKKQQISNLRKSESQIMQRFGVNKFQDSESSTKSPNRSVSPKVRNSQALTKSSRNILSGVSRGISSNSKSSLGNQVVKPRAQSSLGHRSTKNNQKTYLITANPKQIQHYKKTYAKDLPIFEIPQSDFEPELQSSKVKTRKKSKEKPKPKKLVSRSFKKKPKDQNQSFGKLLNLTKEAYDRASDDDMAQSVDDQQWSFEDVLYQKELQNIEQNQNTEVQQTQRPQQARIHLPIQETPRNDSIQQSQNEQTNSQDQIVEQFTPQLHQILNQMVPSSMSTQNGNNIQMPGGVYKNRIDNQSQYFHLENVTINTGPILTGQASKHSTESRHQGYARNNDQGVTTSQIDPNQISNTEPVRINPSPQGQVQSFRDFQELNIPDKTLILGETVQQHESGVKSTSDIHRVSESLYKENTPQF